MDNKELHELKEALSNILNTHIKHLFYKKNIDAKVLVTSMPLNTNGEARIQIAMGKKRVMIRILNTDALFDNKEMDIHYYTDNNAKIVDFYRDLEPKQIALIRVLRICYDVALAVIAGKKVPDGDKITATVETSGAISYSQGF
jgi:hypothetical protein